MSRSLNGQTALVTGSTSGIGRAIAKQLAANGAHVIVSGRSEDRGLQTVEHIRAAGGTADFIHTDLSSAAAAATLAERTIEFVGKLDILVNNAGVFPFVPTLETTEDLFDNVINTNIKGPFFLTAAFAPRFIESGGGVVVNVGSVVADRGIPGAPVYSATKAAIHALGRVWVAEFATKGIRINTVLPGGTETEGVQAGTGDAERAAFISMTPAGRYGAPEEVADAVAFLASDDARYIHGAFLTVDGGLGAL